MIKSSNYYFSNEPIGHPDDDLFNFTPFALKVQEAIRSSCVNDEPMVFGVFGKWGEGKSSFVNLVFRHLEIGVPDGHKKIIKYKFNPWRYLSEDKLLVEFFIGLIKVINSDYSDESKSILISKLKKYTAAFVSGASIEIEKGVNLGVKYTVKTTYNFKDAIEKLGQKKEDADIDKQKEDIDQILKEHPFRIVIFMDDIDRLNKDELYLVFRLLKLIASFKNITYVISCDDEMVAKAIYKNYGDDIHDGKKYLEKIVNVPISLPKVERHHLLYHLKNKLNLLFTQNKIAVNELDQNPERTFQTGANRFFSEVSGIERHIDTPRMLNRLVNSFGTSIIALKGEVNYSDLIWLELLRLQYFPVYNFIKNKPQVFIGQGSLFTSFISEREKVIPEELEQLINDDSKLKANRDKIEIIIQDYLFPMAKEENVISAFQTRQDEAYKVKMDADLSKKERRINHSECFGIYFNFNTAEQISNIELESLITLIQNKDDKAQAEFETFLESNNGQKFLYEILDRDELFKDTKESFNFINFILNNLDKLIDDNKTRDVHSQTQREHYVNQLFEKAKSLDDQLRQKLVDSFILSCSIPDILYLRKGLFTEKFEGSNIQQLVDKQLIDKVKLDYKDDVFFKEFPQHEVRAIFSLWKSKDKDDLQSYLKNHLNGLTIKDFIDCFPTIWSGPSGSYLDDFKQENYEFLSTLINPSEIAEIIREEYGDQLSLPEYKGDQLWRLDENKKEFSLMAQFMYLHDKDKIRNESLKDEKMIELSIEVIRKGGKSIMLSNGVNFIANPDYYKIVEQWKEGDIVKVKKNDSHGDKLSYTITNGKSTILAMRN